MGIQEVPLCGHATLASAKVLFLSHPLSQLISFETLSGTLIATRDGEKNIALDLPADLTSMDRQTEGEMFEGLRKMAEEAMPGCRGNVVAVAMGLAPIIELNDGVILEDLGVDSNVFVSPLISFNPSRLTTTQLKHGHNIVYFTQSVLRSDKTCDIYSRVFGPGYGIPEDPVVRSLSPQLSHLD